MLEKLRLINEDILKTSKNSDIIYKHKLIKIILEDENCFFKMNIEHAYAILKDLGIPDNELKYVYLKAIDASEMKTEN